MKKWLKSLSKEQIQRYVFVGLLVLVFVAFFVSLSIASNNEGSQNNNDPIENPNDDNSNNNDNNNQGNNGDEGDENQNSQNTPLPTIEKLGIPIDGDFVVVRKYYDMDDSAEEQELSVIQFGKRYYTSNGIGISNKENTEFNVLAALSGEVVSVDESPIYGIVVTIKHERELYTEYGSLSSANVVVGAEVKQGDVIGVSGVCEYDSSLQSHVYFKVMSKANTFDPEEVIGKTVLEVMK